MGLLLKQGGLMSEGIRGRGVGFFIKINTVLTLERSLFQWVKALPHIEFDCLFEL